MSGHFYSSDPPLKLTTIERFGYALIFVIIYCRRADLLCDCVEISTHAFLLQLILVPALIGVIITKMKIYKNEANPIFY